MLPSVYLGLLVVVEIVVSWRENGGVSWWIWVMRWGTYSRSSWPMLPAPPRPVETMEVCSVIVVSNWSFEAVVEMRVRVSIIAMAEISR